MDHNTTDWPTQLKWKGLSTASAIAASMVTRQVLQAAWTSFGPGDQEPPLNPADRRTGWPLAVQWTIAAGVGVGLGRLVSQRAAAAGWEAATGSPPPGIKT